MNHTPNYQLSQWVKSDQVKMEGFNADNAKLAAVLVSMMKFELIKTVVLPASAATMAVDVSDISWAQWRYIILEMKLKTNGDQTHNRRCRHAVSSDFGNCDKRRDESRG